MTAEHNQDITSGYLKNAYLDNLSLNQSAEFGPFAQANIWQKIVAWQKTVSDLWIHQDKDSAKSDSLYSSVYSRDDAKYSHDQATLNEEMAWFVNNGYTVTDNQHLDLIRFTSPHLDISQVDISQIDYITGMRQGTSFDQRVSFFQVDDAQQIDNITGMVEGAAIAHNDYMPAVTGSLVSPTFSINLNSTINETLEFDAVLAKSEIKSDRILNEALDGSAEIYIKYLGTNSGHKSFYHIKNVEINTFDFKGLPNFGNQDFISIVI